MSCCSAITPARLSRRPTPSSPCCGGLRRRGAVWSQWRAALAPLARPDASRAIPRICWPGAAITAA